MSLDDKIDECWISANYAFRFFTKQDVDFFLESLNGENGLPPKGTNIMFRIVKLKNPISKGQILDMSNEDMKLFLQMIDS